MAHSHEVRLAVRTSFVRERLPLEAAAEKHGVSYHTVRTWKKKAAEDGDDWDRARVAGRMAEGGLGDVTAQVMEDFIILFQSTLVDIKEGEFDGLQKTDALSRLADAFAKTAKAAGGSDAKIAKLAVAMQVLEEFAKYIKEEREELLEPFATILEPFGQRVSEMFG